MIRPFRSLLLALLLVHGSSASLVQGQWTPINTGINANLYDISVFNGSMIVCSSMGLYKGSAPYTSFSPMVPGSAADQVVLGNTRLREVVFSAVNDAVIVGTDTVLGRGVIFRFDPQAGTGALVWSGPVGTALNGVCLVLYGQNHYLAVGDDGLCVRSTSLNWIPDTPFTTEDLNAVSFSTTTTYYAGEGHMYYQFTDDAPVPEVMGQFRDVFARTAGTATAIDGSNPWSRISGMFNVNPHHEPMVPLCAGKFWDQGKYLVGTANGIYMNTTGTVYERQISADGYRVNDLDCPGQVLAYAACDGGWLLSTTNQGGQIQPWVELVAPNGTCVNTNGYFSQIGGPNNSIWMVDGVQYGSTYNFSRFFSAVGVYTITLISANGPLADTATMQFPVVLPPPVTNVSFTVADTVLCHAEPVSVTLANSDPVYRYRLFEHGGDDDLVTATGNGGALTLTTPPISASSQLGIEVLHVAVDCSNRLSDTIGVRVEHTRAAFMQGLLNAAPNEQMHLFDLSGETVSWAWDFGVGATPATSILAEPVVHWSTLGPTSVTLVATSADGCTDTLTLEGPVIYDPATLVDDCWAMDMFPSMSNSSGYVTQSHSTSRSLCADRTGTSLYMAGVLNTSELNSRAGRKGTTQKPDRGDMFLARYDRQGVLKWMAKGHMGAFTNDAGDGMYPWAEASHLSGDVFFSGGCDPVFLPLTGTDSITLPGAILNGRYFNRVDSLGRVLWNVSVNWTTVTMTIDAQDNMYLIAMPFDNGFYPNRLIDAAQDTVPLLSGRSYLVKLNPQGLYQWKVDLNGIIPYIAVPHALTTDPSGNVYLGGSHQNPFWVTSTNGDSTYVMNTSGGFRWSHLLKIDPAGVCQWARVIRDSHGMSRLVTDNAGNIYANPMMGGAITSFSNGAQPDVPVANGWSILLYSYDTNGTLRWFVRGSYRLFDGVLTYDGADRVHVFGSVPTAGPFPPYNVFDVNGVPTPSFSSSSNDLVAIASWDLQGLNPRLAPAADPICFRTSVFPGGMQADVNEVNALFGAGLSSLDDSLSVVAGDTLIWANDLDNALIWAHFNTDLCQPPLVLAKPENAEHAPTWTVFPNPSTGTYTVDLSTLPATMFDLFVFDPTGRTVAHERSLGGRSVNVSLNNVAPGTYRLQLRDDQSVHGARPLLLLE